MRDKQTMDNDEFKKRGKEIIDYIVNYRETIRERKVTPSVKPNYLKPLLPTEAPMYPEKFEDIMKDFEEKIMLGMVHWNHPNFFAYFPSANSYPSLIGDMLSDMIACIGFSWASAPSCTELEIIVLDWLCKALELPNKFLSSTKGGGVLLGSASEAVFIVMVSARTAALNALAKKHGVDDDHKVEFLPRLVAYCSKESHSCVEKAAKLCLIKLRILEVNDSGSLTAETLEKAMSEDEDNGLVPFFFSAIFGSTSQTAFDDLTQLGPVCAKRQNFWLHVDAAYAGSAFLCPEMRYLMDGMEYVNSFNLNPNKWMLVHFDASVLFMDNTLKVTSGLVVDPLYLRHEYSGGIIDRRNFSVALSRRFRALKIWFVFRLYGINGIQEYIRNHMKCAKYFETLVLKDDRFEVMNIVRCGLVCFRLKGENVLTEELLAELNHSRKLHMIPTKIKKDKFVIRFCVDYEQASLGDMDYAWEVISEHATKLLSLVPTKQAPKTPEDILHRRRQSFTRSISREDFAKRSSSLYDGATPILVVDEDGEELNVFDEVFAKMTVN